MNFYNEKDSYVTGSKFNYINTDSDRTVRDIGHGNQVIITGERAKVHYMLNEDPYFTDEMGQNGGGANYIATGNGSHIQSLKGTVAYASGDESKVDSIGVGTQTTSFYPDNSVSICSGKKSRATAAGNNSIAVTTGKYSTASCSVNSGSNGENSRVASVGDESSVGSHDKLVPSSITETISAVLMGHRSQANGAFKDLYVSGNESSVNLSYIHEDESFPGDIFISGKSVSIATIRNIYNTNKKLQSTLAVVSKHPLETFDAGKNSVLVAGWHDGIRQRYNVYYEGTDFEAGKVYKTDEQGKLVYLSDMEK
ncbi:hypothetical protein GKR50_09730 [Providencia rustigianii]|uniref:hypothetical protein n=1 Tax=Providencia rustigianii TaxID=158850 RepID=UPI000F6DB4AE|nr:hypothetical protein [Providencia rustigianii]MTC60294.1 hypothetical protein [Providencia rustigianii]VEH54925.1 Uncharacterised protein [Providencia rustigianii]